MSESKSRKRSSLKKHQLDTPGYSKFNKNEEIPHDEATRVRVRMEFKNKLLSLTARHDPLQEYCDGCETLPPPTAIAFSRMNIKRLGQEQQEQQHPPPTAAPSSTSRTSHVDRNYGMTFEYVNHLGEQTTTAPNPARIPHSEVGTVMAAFTNQHLAHEIAINQCFRLKHSDDVVDPSPSHDLKESMKEAFWSLLQEEVTNKDGFKQTLAAIEELKDSMISLMMPHNHELRDQVNQILDMQRLGTEVKAQPFDYECYLPYVLDVLGKICCPSRDVEVSLARKLKNPVSQLRAIYALVDNMKADMDNFFINLYRPAILKNAIEGERKKFADYLELEYRLHEDGLRATRAWILRHRIGVRDPLTVLAKGYGEILGWSGKEAWPETLLEDLNRLQRLQRTLVRIGIIGGIVLGLGKACNTIFKNPPPKLRQIFSRYMKLLIPEDDTVSDEKLKSCLDKAAEKAVEATEKVMTKYLRRSLSPEQKDLIQSAVLSVGSPDHTFRSLIIKRTVNYTEEVILAARDYHTPVPSTLSSMTYEVALLVNEFHRLVLFNRACFEELYTDMVEGHNKAPVYPEQNDWNWDISLLSTIKKLRSRLATPEEAVSLEDKFTTLESHLIRDAAAAASHNNEDYNTGAENISVESVGSQVSRSVERLSQDGKEAPAETEVEPALSRPKFDFKTRSFEFYERYQTPSAAAVVPDAVQKRELEITRAHNMETAHKEEIQFKAFCAECSCP